MFELTPFDRGIRNLSFFDPFKDFGDFDKKFFEKSVLPFNTDIKETESAYILEADLPGFAKEEIHAEIKDNTLLIKAEHKSEKEEKDEKTKYVRRERCYGSYCRSFNLEGIKTDEIAASYDNGVLKLTLPKLEEKQLEARKLEIK